MDLCGVNVKNNLLYPTNSFSSGTTRSSFYNNAEITNCKQQQFQRRRRRIPFLVVNANAGGDGDKSNNHGDWREFRAKLYRDELVMLNTVVTYWMLGLISLTEFVFDDLINRKK